MSHEFTCFCSNARVGIMADGKQLEELVATIEKLLLPHGFEVNE